MAFCPICRVEYITGVTQCSDCEVELVAELPPEPPLPEDETADYQLLTENENEIDARLVVAELEAEGIPYILAGDEVGTVMIYPAKDSRILVPENYLEKAREVLKNTMTTLGDDETGEAVETEIFFCDHCGAEVPPNSEKCPECGEPFENT